MANNEEVNIEAPKPAVSETKDISEISALISKSTDVMEEMKSDEKPWIMMTNVISYTDVNESS